MPLVTPPLTPATRNKSGPKSERRHVLQRNIRHIRLIAIGPGGGTGRRTGLKIYLWYDLPLKIKHLS